MKHASFHLAFLFAIATSLLPTEQATCREIRSSVLVNSGWVASSLSRDFPSIFLAWSENLEHGINTRAGMALHDLMILTPQQMGLARVDQKNPLDNASVNSALKMRHSLEGLNPKITLIVEIRYFNAADKYLPLDSPLWRRDRTGARITSGEETPDHSKLYLLDFGKRELQDSVAAQCKAYTDTRVFDGCMFDWWNEAYSDMPATEGTARLSMIKTVRAAVGDDILLVGNVNGTIPKLTGPYLNAVYMEGFGARGFSDWRRAVDNLIWLQANLRAPALTMLEGWYDCGACTGDVAAIQARGRGDLALMREVTTLSLTNSDGYVLFGDPNALPTPDHLHDWYPFWDKMLGHPVGPKHVQATDGAFHRAFDNGCAVFNPPDNHVITVSFRVPHRSEATGTIASKHTVNKGDGDIFLSVSTDGQGRGVQFDACAQSDK